MDHIQAPENDATASERSLKCRGEIEAAMMRLIRAAKKLGWSEIEITMALADAAEDHVLNLARASTRRH